jgi:hypothetical protein
MKTNSNNNHNSVFSSPLPILLILLVIVLVFAGNLSAGQNSTDVENELAPELRASAEGTEGSHQDTEAGQYERYYRTLINDPADGREKLVELRYTKDGRLSEILIDDRTLTRAERRKNDKIISRAMAEERKVEKEIDEMVDGIGSAVEETMEVISDVFGSVFEDLCDGNTGEADTRGEESSNEPRKRDRKARLSTLEELESN